VVGCIVSPQKMEQMMDRMLAKMDSFQENIDDSQEKMDAFQKEMRTNSEKFEVLRSTRLPGGYPPSLDRGHSGRNNSQDWRPSGKDGS
jgi:DNA gyrase/topoisomerase IV subunit A